MERRKFLIGAAGTAIGGSALVGSGAFTSVEAERDVTVEVGGDNDAYLGLEAERDDIISDDGGSDQLTIDLGSETTEEGGEGFNQEAITKVEGVFSITNQGTQEVGAGFRDDEDDAIRNRNLIPEKEVLPGATLKVPEDERDPHNSLDEDVAVLGPGDSVEIDVEVDTLNEAPQDETDGSVVIGAYVDDF